MATREELLARKKEYEKTLQELVLGSQTDEAEAQWALTQAKLRFTNQQLQNSTGLTDPVSSNLQINQQDTPVVINSISTNSNVPVNNVGTPGIVQDSGAVTFPYRSGAIPVPEDDCSVNLDCGEPEIFDSGFGPIQNNEPVAFDDFFLDHSDELDDIAARYGVDPTSEQARQLWEQEYGDDILETDPNAAFNTINGSNFAANRKPIEKSDWRFRVRLSPFSDYLYNRPGAETSLLRPLKATDGVIFPYTPSITVPNQANYESYELTHSNHRGYFYRGSYTGEIMVNATFTAQDTAEAEYLLAVITFFKACTKMFYGQDKGRRGTPPPLLYMTGFGEYAFNEHPCVLQTFNVDYPNDVDYIRTHVGPKTNSEWTGRMDSPSGHQSWSGRISRLISSGLSGQGFDFKGALAGTFGIPELDLSPGRSDTGSSYQGSETYVPTELNMSLIFLPVQTRDQVSNEFSLEKYASGELIKKGYW